MTKRPISADEHLADLSRPADHDARMMVMRRAAEWYLGDASWAGELLAAYLYPRYVTEALDEEMRHE
jgi:hypothetical protein